MLGITLANLRAHKGRLLLSSLAIVLATAFVAGTFVFTDAMRSALFSTFAADLGEADVVVTATDDSDVSEDTVDAVREVDGVGHAEQRTTWDAVLRSAGDRIEPATIVSVSADTTLGWPQVTEGELPKRPGEAVVDRDTAKSRGAGVGDTVEVPRNWENPDSDTSDVAELRVVGLVDVGDSPSYAGTPFVGVSEEQIRQLSDDATTDMVLAVGENGDSGGDLAGRVDAAVGPGNEVSTAEEHADDEVSSGGMTTTTSAVLFAFAGIALFVSAIVIANTFSILLAQRTREMALLRCVGATRGQVFRSLLAESVVLGTAASAVGVAVGFGLAYGVGAALTAMFEGFPFGSVALSPLAVAVPVAVGVAVTVGAALLPARAATRIRPIAALRDQGVPAARAGRVRIAVAVVLMVVGVAALGVGTLVLASSVPGFLLAFAGGTAVFLGVLLASPVLVPPLVRLVGAVFGRLLGTSGRLAAVNAVRNPRRASATTAALLVGVTLMTLMSVGAASLRATVDAEIDAEFPVDYMVRSSAADIPESMVDDVRDMPAMSDVTAVYGATAPLDGGEVWVSGVDPGELSTVTTQLAEITQLREGEVVVTEALADQRDVGPGATLTLGEDERATELTVRAVAASGGPEAAYITQQDHATIFPDAGVAGIFADAAPDADLVEVSSAVDRVTAGSDVTVTGTAKTEATYTEVLDTVLLIVTALLAVAVLIAIFGIANTLALSVIERTRESALLRALGLTRGQLRATLAVEAALLAIVGALLGVGLGTFFGWVGLTSLVGSDLEIVLAVPGLQLLGLVAVAVASGVLASVLPARRAARASVVSALSNE